MKYNPFDRAVPGQSLTNEPGNYPWEHPPQFTDPKEASEFLWEKLHNPKMLEQMIMLLESQVPVEALVRVVLFNGFSEGKWTPDLAILLAPILTQQIIAIGKKAEIKSMRILLNDDTNTKFRVGMQKLKRKEAKLKSQSPEAQKEAMLKKIEEDIEAEKSKGLMGKKEEDMDMEDEE